jgi:hypothetical protein
MTSHQTSLEQMEFVRGEMAGTRAKAAADRLIAPLARHGLAGAVDGHHQAHQKHRPSDEHPHRVRQPSPPAPGRTAFGRASGGLCLSVVGGASGAANAQPDIRACQSTAETWAMTPG